MPNRTNPLERMALGAWLRDNWTWAASTGYLYVTYVGMLQSWTHFRTFNIDVFEFSELNDFLLAAFREPRSVMFLGVLVLYAIVIHFLTNVVQHFQQKRLRTIRSELQQDEEGGVLHDIDMIGIEGRIRRNESVFRNVGLAATGISVMLVVMAPWMASNYVGYSARHEILTDSTRRFSVVYSGEKIEESHRTRLRNLIFIGTTEKYLFFLQEVSTATQQYRVHIFPAQSVHAISREQVDVVQDHDGTD